MKLLCATLMIVFFLFGGLGNADDRCPLTDNTYVFIAGDIQFELSGFDCTFGPGCQADCDLWYGNFDTGPIYHERLPFTCAVDGSVVLTIRQIEIPCALNSQGNLECLTADIAEYHCVSLGEKIWCFSEEPGQFKFIQEE